MTRRMTKNVGNRILSADVAIVLVWRPFSIGMGQKLLVDNVGGVGRTPVDDIAADTKDLDLSEATREIIKSISQKIRSTKAYLWQT